MSHSVSRRHGQHFSLYVCVCVSCYGMALKQQPAVSSVWHDLGVCYYHVMKVVEGHQVKLMAGNCVISLKQALRLEPTNHCHWNALGVAAAHPGSLFFFLLAGLREAHHACQFYIYSVIQKWDFCPTWVTHYSDECESLQISHLSGQKCGNIATKLSKFGILCTNLPLGRLACTIFTKFSAFIHVHRSLSRF